MAKTCTSIQKSLGWCQGTPELPGVKRRIYFIAKSFIVGFPQLPRDELGRSTSAVLVGDFVLMAGASSEDIRLNGTLTVEDYQTRAKAIEAQKPAKRVSASTNPEDAENVLDEKINTAWQGNKGDYITFALKNGTQAVSYTHLRAHET